MTGTNRVEKPSAINLVRTDDHTHGKRRSKVWWKRLLSWHETLRTPEIRLTSFVAEVERQQKRLLDEEKRAREAELKTAAIRMEQERRKQEFIDLFNSSQVAVAYGLLLREEKNYYSGGNWRDPRTTYSYYLYRDGKSVILFNDKDGEFIFDSSGNLVWRDGKHPGVTESDEILKIFLDQAAKKIGSGELGSTKPSFYGFMRGWYRSHLK